MTGGASRLVETLQYAGALLLCFSLFVQNRIGIGEVGGMIVLVGTIQKQIEALINSEGGLNAELEYVRIGFGFLEMKEEEVLPAGEAREETGLVVDHVSYRYEGCERTAVDNISFCIKPGEVVSIVGENGAGKSTLLKLML